MAADQRGAMLARIADLRGKRLTREANEAHEAAETARLAAERARAERAAAAAARDEARLAFTATPACAQARLWLDRKIAGETSALAQLSDRSAQLDIARDTHGAAIDALARHQVRTDIVAEHHRTLRRAQDRRAEDRIETDAPAPLQARIA
jgi:hypothetical protein